MLDILVKVPVKYCVHGSVLVTLEFQWEASRHNISHWAASQTRSSMSSINAPLQ
jgi:hypothetical protein